MRSLAKVHDPLGVRFYFSGPSTTNLIDKFRYQSYHHLCRRRIYSINHTCTIQLYANGYTSSV